MMKIKNSLGHLLLFHILWSSSLITLVITMFQLYLDYQEDIDLVENRMMQIQQSYVPIITESLWVQNMEQLRPQLEAILRLPDMKSLEIYANDELLISVGIKTAKYTIDRNFPLTYLYKNKEVNLGVLVVKSDLEAIYTRLYERLIVILTTQAFKTFLVSSFILFIVHHLIIRHLSNIASYTKKLDLHQIDHSLYLERPDRNDELKSVVQALHSMQSNLQQSHAQLQEYQNHLEEQVRERTQALRMVNDLLEEDLELAAKFQQSLLSIVTEVPFLKIACRNFPHSKVSGDVYDMSINREKEFCFFLGDATGHGVAAAFMTMMVAIGLDTVPHHLSSDEVIRQINQLLASRQPEKWITGIYFRISPDGQLKACNAGHPSLVIIPQNGDPVVRLNERGCPLGMFQDEVVPYMEETYRLEEGDKVFLYTDGVIEWGNADDQFFGEKQLLRFLDEHRDLEVTMLLDHLFVHLQTFANGHACNDDLTMSCFQYHRTP